MAVVVRHGEETGRGMAGGSAAASVGPRRLVAHHLGNDSGTRWLHDSSYDTLAQVQVRRGELRLAAQTLQTLGLQTISIGVRVLIPKCVAMGGGRVGVGPWHGFQVGGRRQ
jgi:hypothetical protein